MVTELNNQQIAYVEDFLTAHQLDYLPLKEEMLDHICCMIESRMAEGISFHLASKKVFDTFGKDDMKELQDQTIFLLEQKPLTMKKISFLVLGLLLTAFTLVWGMKADPPSSYPLGKDFEVTSHFGMRLHPVYKKKKMHFGIDFRAPVGTPVYATSDGVVEKVAEQKRGYGNHIVLRHDDSFKSLYAQLSEIKVDSGQSVKKGDLIGLVGSSGTSTAPHLHYEVIKDGKKVDPVNYFTP